MFSMSHIHYVFHNIQVNQLSESVFGETGFSHCQLPSEYTGDSNLPWANRVSLCCHSFFERPFLDMILYLLQTVKNASVKGTNDELDVVSVELTMARDRCQRLPTWIYPHFEHSLDRLRIRKSTSLHIEQSVKSDVGIGWIAT